MIVEAGRFVVNTFVEIILLDDERIVGVRATPYSFDNQAHYKDFQFMICKMQKPVKVI